MVIGSGRCHGPGCQQPADGDFCSEEHQRAWHAQFWQVPKTNEVQLRSSDGWTVGTLVGDPFEQPEEHELARHEFQWPRVSVDVALTPDGVRHFRDLMGGVSVADVARNLGAALGGISAAGAAVAACGIGQTVAHSAEVERLTLFLREVCPPERFDDAMAEVEDLMDRTWMPRAEALERVISDGRFAHPSATKQQVASPNPQVSYSGWRGWLARLRRTQ